MKLMFDLSIIYEFLSKLLPLDFMQFRFMQQALMGLLLLAPMTAITGLQVVNFRMAFFSDAISHSAFTGIALGLLFSINPNVSMPMFGLLVGISITISMRRSKLPTDTIVGVILAAVIALGLALMSRDRSIGRELPRFLYGDILTIDEAEIGYLLLLFLLIILFQIFSHNRLLAIGLNETVSKIHGVHVAFYQYANAALLSLVVIVSVKAVGFLLVTAMLVVPAATARNFAKNAGSMFWWAVFISITSAILGLLISAQSWARTATGATVVLCAFGWFTVSLLYQYASGLFSRIFRFYQKQNTSL